MKRYLIAGITVLALSAGALSMAYADNTKIRLKIDEPTMTVNGEEVNIDENGTVPVISNGRTLVPIRAVVEAMGGNVGWNSETSTALLDCDNNHIELTIGSKTAVLNGESKALDTEPVIINSRTMLPLRFVSESFGYNVEWNNEDKSITISDKTADTVQPEEISGNENILVVYFTRAENTEIDENVDAVSSASLNSINGEITGNTKLAADYVHDKVGGDIVNIEAVNLYPADYRSNVDLANDELDGKVRPEIKTHIENFDKYDTVYLLYPIWWGTMPMPVYTFIESHDFDGKTIIPIATHKGSGMGSTQKDVENALPNAKVIKGFSIEGDDAVNAINEVTKKLDELEF